MAMFVHLTAEKNVKRILRNGITRLGRTCNAPHGIFAMPVTRNFYVSHQWLRELRRKGQSPMVAVYFRIPDGDAVWVGHYNRSHRKMTAAKALALITKQSSPEGYEVIVPRKITESQIHRIKRLPQVLGWRYNPDSHGKKPCRCPVCLRGRYGAQKLREA